MNREKSQFQSSAAVFTQETQQEFAELRDRANRIRLEASEAIAAKDNQQFHERELKSDEAMKLKQRNVPLISGLSFAQHGAIQARHLIVSKELQILVEGAEGWSPKKNSWHVTRQVRCVLWNHTLT